MCGIAGLFLKNPDLQPHLGALTAKMLTLLNDRGPDSAGFAVYGAAVPGFAKITVRLLREMDDAALRIRLVAAGIKIATTVRHDSHLVLEVEVGQVAAARAWLRAIPDELQVVGIGNRMELFKDVGLPERVAAQFGLPAMRGTHAIGHTRMATESSVTTAGAHPFSTGIDQCLVHNGSLSNHNTVRRTLEREGSSFETENDSEVAAGYLSWRMGEGDSLKQALTQSLDVLDGFYTFVVGTERGFAVLRDPICCKPAVMAETDSYVAFGSEYRALTVLPQIEKARVFEPEPATVYVWEHPE
jgi:glutamate synthase domain-containing protein 1